MTPRRKTYTIAAAAAAAAVVGTVALVGCGGDEPSTPTPTATASPSTSPMPATAAETAQEAFRFLAMNQQSTPTAVTEACRFFDEDAYRIGPDPDEYGYENSDGKTPEQEWPDVPMVRWCGPDDAAFPEPLGTYALDGQYPEVMEEVRNDDGTRWVRVQFEGQTGSEPVPLQRVAAVAPQDDGTWRIERWCYVPTWDADGRYTTEVKDPFTCLEATR